MSFKAKEYLHSGDLTYTRLARSTSLEGKHIVVGVQTHSSCIPTTMSLLSNGLFSEKTALFVNNLKRTYRCTKSTFLLFDAQKVVLQSLTQRNGAETVQKDVGYFIERILYTTVCQRHTRQM